MRIQKPTVLQYVLLGVLFVGTCAYQVRATIAAFPGFLSNGSPEWGWPFTLYYSKGQPTATFVSDVARRAGVSEGDVVTQVDGRPLTGTAVFGERVANAKSGDNLQVTVRSPRGTNEHTVAIPFEPASATVSWVLAALVMLKVILPVVSILLGFWTAFVRPRDIAAWLLLGVLLGLSSVFTSGAESWGPRVRDLATLYYAVMSKLWPICMLLFGLYFPEPFPPLRARFWVWLAKWILVPLLVADGLAEIVIAIGRMDNYARVAPLDVFRQPLEQVLFALTLIAIGSFFSCIWAKSSMAVSADAKRRLRLLGWGTTASMAPSFILVVVSRIKGGWPEQVFPEPLVLSSFAMMLFFPVTLAYVIVVQRAMDVRVVIRQGLQYALAKGGIRALRLAIGVVLGLGIIYLWGHIGRNALVQYVIIALGVALWLSAKHICEKLRAWTDRRFFRDAYNAEHILASLSDEVRSIVETQPLLERVATKIAESLHVPRIAVLLQQGSLYRPAYALGYGSAPQAEFRTTEGTIERLRKEAEPTRVYFDDEDSWVNVELPEDERQKLVALGPQLLLPLTVKDKLLGLVSLGEKRSEEPYSSADLRLLKSVAMQTGLALANAQLTTAIAEEVARREKINRELEIAREVQERLFPQSQPAIAGLDYYGKCRTALGVGGDYYDFLALPGGKLGVALGDVSGKGIAAALMMASLEASLRAEAARAFGDPGQMIGRVNQLIYDASAEDRYATLFYAEYDPAHRSLTYVNAGHNAPILLRKGCSGVERLDKAGGPVVGLIPECTYEHALVALNPGDMLVIYTDGISEAMNPELHEWGEERLIAATRASTGLRSVEVVAQIMHAAEVHAGGAPQSDDMTLVVVRVVND